MNIKQNIKRLPVLILIYFFIAMAILTYVSKQIYRAKLPEVIVKETVTGNLETIIDTTGTFYYKTENYVFSPLSCHVSHVFVKKGERVYLETPLLAFNMADLENQAATIKKQIKNIEVSNNTLRDDTVQTNHKKQQILNSIENTEQKIELANLKKETLQKEIDMLTEGDDYSLELNRYLSEIERAKNDYNNNKALYEAGALSGKELDNSKNSLDLITFEYEQLVKTIEDNEKDRTLSLEDREYSYENTLTQIAAYKKEIEELKSEYLLTDGLSFENDRIKLEVNKLDTEELRDKLSKINALIENGGVLKSEYKGIVTYINTDEYISQNDKLITISDNSGDSYIEWFFSEEDVDKFKENISVTAVITTLVDNAQKDDYIEERVEIKFSSFGRSFDVLKNKYLCSAAIKGDKYLLGMAYGEKLNVSVSSISRSYDYIIPKSAVIFTSKDKGSVFVLAERKKSYGDEYYIRKESVSISAYDDINAAITMGFKGEKIIVETDKPLNDNMAVKVRETP